MHTRTVAALSVAVTIVAVNVYDSVAENFRPNPTPQEAHCQYLDRMFSGFVMDANWNPSHLRVVEGKCQDPRTGLEVTEDSLPY